MNKFSTKLPFDPIVPYEELFAERLPLVQALHVAIGNFIANRSKFRAASQKAEAMRERLSNECFQLIECGVFQGNALAASVQILEESGIDYFAVGLDTFEGFPDLSEVDRKLAPENAPYLRSRFFSDTTVEDVQRRLEEYASSKRVELRKGLFKDTLPTLPDRRYHFVNIDCDIYEPHLECLEYFYGRMEPGGVIFFDDYYSLDYPMARAAIDHFLSDKPEHLFHLRYGKEGPNRMKTYIVKF